MRTLSHYLRVYKRLLVMNWLSLLVYPANFFNAGVASVAWGFFSLYSIILLTFSVTNVWGWHREELLFLNGMYGVIVGIFHMVFSNNMYNLPRKIHLGELDNLLLKPMDEQFLISVWSTNFTSILRIGMTLVYVLYLLVSLHILFSIERIIFFIVLAICGIILLYAIWYLILTITIWYSKLTNLVDLLFTIQGVSRYPQEMTKQLAFYFFVFFFPWTLPITIPAKVLLGKDTGEVTQLLLLTGLSVGACRFFWKFALRYYTSASS